MARLLFLFWGRWSSTSTLLLQSIACLSLAGCQKPDEIVRYTVAKPPAHEGKPARVQQSPPGDANLAIDRETTDQLVGAIIPRGATTWFFKLTGPSPAVESQKQSFVQFVKSIRFKDKGPEWALPAGWEEEPGTEMRFATLRISTPHGPLEMSVIPLPTSDGSFDAYLLSNVNRWREQLRLPPITNDELPEKTVEFDIEGTPAWLAAFEGRLTQQRMGGGPFAGAGGGPFAGKNTVPPQRPAGTESPDSPPFTCEVPEGWTVVNAGQMQLAKYEVRDSNRKVEITVSTAKGDLVDNVNRWRGQVQLAELDAAALKKELGKTKVDGHDAVLVALLGPEAAKGRESILGVIVEAQGNQWFIKLKGDADLAAREVEHFNEFVQSIRFRKE